MAENTQNSRYVHHRWNMAGVTPSVPTVDDITSASFSTTDIKRGEIAINLQDERVWFRSNFGVVEINTSSTFSSTPLDLQIVSDNGYITTNKLNFPQWQVGDVDGVNNIYMDNSLEVSVVSSNPTFSGIVYGDDYSANYTDMSLVNKAYVLSLADTIKLKGVLNAGNDTDTHSIIMGTGTSIKSGHGGGQIDLDSFGVAGSVMLTNDNGGYTDSTINLYSGGIDMYQLGSGGLTSNLSLYAGDAYFGVTKNIGGSTQFINGVVIRHNLGATATNPNPSLGCAGVFINSPGSITNADIYNTVCIGGNNLLADEANTVYVPNLNIQAGNVIKSSSGDCIIDIDGSYFYTENTGGFEAYIGSGSVNTDLLMDSSSVYLTLSTGGGSDQAQGIVLVDNTGSNKTSPIHTGRALFLNSKNSTINSGVVGSVVIGGDTLTATQSNTVYVPNLNIQAGKLIKTSNGGGQIALDEAGTPNTVVITTDGGGYGEAYIYMDSSILQLASQTSVLLETPSNSLQVNESTDSIAIVTGTTSFNSNISIATNKSIKSGNTGGQIDLDAYGIGGNVLITTDAGVEATPYIRMNTANINLVAATVSMVFESSNSRIQIGGPTGLLIGRCTTAEKTAIPASNGMICYDTTLNKFSFYQAGAWVEPF